MHNYDDQGTKRCGNIFRLFVVQGESQQCFYNQTGTTIPETDTEARIGFYCSIQIHMYSILTMQVRTRRIGEIKLSIPNPTDQPCSLLNEQSKSR